MSRYNIIRRDRLTDTTGGGVCAFISKLHNVVEVSIDESCSPVELCCFDIIANSNNGSKCRFFNVYRRSECDSVAELIYCLEKYSNPRGLSIIAGDLNCRKIN